MSNAANSAAHEVCYQAFAQRYLAETQRELCPPAAERQRVARTRAA